MMVDLFGQARAPFTEATLHRWRRLVVNGRTDLIDIGRYRTGGDPMQIISGPIGRPKVHFEAPPAAAVPAEMRRFWSWIERTAPERAQPLPPLTRAGVAHLWFESIHPYEDGNGRIRRAISEKILAQGLPTPALTGMAGTLRLHRRAYYAALECAHGNLDITDWLFWFAAKTIEAQRGALQHVEFVLVKDRLMSALREAINARQEKALLRVFEAGPDGFRGGLSAGNYMRITGAPPATATRDLVALVSLGALLRAGEHKSTRYRLNVPFGAVTPVEPEDVA
jgi:Fic family protein